MQTRLLQLIPPEKDLLDSKDETSWAFEPEYWDQIVRASRLNHAPDLTMPLWFSNAETDVKIIELKLRAVGDLGLAHKC